MVTNKEARTARETKPDELQERQTGAVEQLVTRHDWRRVLRGASGAPLMGCGCRDALAGVPVWVLVAHLPFGRRHRGRALYTWRRRSCGPGWLGQPRVREPGEVTCPADPAA